MAGKLECEVANLGLKEWKNKSSNSREGVKGPEFKPFLCYHMLGKI